MPKAVARTAIALLLAAPALAQEANLRDALANLKITGYVQAQYVEGEAPEASTFEVRRGRLILQYQLAPSSRLVVAPDFSSSGVAMRDVFVTLTEPWTGWKHTLTAGQFKIPFGAEIRRSARDLELPERARVFTTLFPDAHRDRGIMLGGEGPGGNFTYRIALLNGNALEGPFDIDDAKDVSGRIGFETLAFEAGLSGYEGAQPGQDKTRYGLDAQWTTPLPGLLFRGEYIEGVQPSSGGEHDVRGFFVSAVQRAGKRHQFVLRYDTYDPDTEAGHDDIETIGGAYSFQWDTNVRLMIAYESGDADDHLVTVRIQYAF
jgi:hypothetical protein